MRASMRLALGVVPLLVSSIAYCDPELRAPRYVDAERALRGRLGGRALERASPGLSAAIVRLAEGLPAGGAIHLGDLPCGRLDFRRVADGVQITGGREGTIVLGSGQRGIQLLFSNLDQVIERGVPRPERKRLPGAVAAKPFADVRQFDKDAAPASDLLALFCNGGIHINADVRNCAWLCGANAFGKKVVTANARVDDCLFLWFGINWSFADYNAHLDPGQAGRDWLENAQLWFDCKGGGEGTRLYMMIETNYGNPGPGVVLRNCRNMALYHGTTERASSQGPGVYWLKDCRGVKLGLRGINAFAPVVDYHKAPVPSHDLTIEGGEGNVIHGMRLWGHSQGATAVASDPRLQVWCAAFQYETEGMADDSILRFACTPYDQRPSPALLARERPRFRERAAALLRKRRQKVSDEAVEDIVRRIERGRFLDPPWTAAGEQTFVFEGHDLTKGAPAGGTVRPLPPPPSVPATDAPRVDRPVEFTQQPEFGRELLAAGADPTGRRPSDDAFAKVMFGMTRAEVQALLEKSYRADADFRRSRERGDRDGMAAARAAIDRVMDRLHPLADEEKERIVSGKGRRNNPRRIKRPRLEIPPGTFRLEHTLVVMGGWDRVWGAGPEKTILKAGPGIKVVELHVGFDSVLANLQVDGGRVGVAMTGQDHSDPVSPTTHSYVAGGSFYNLTFRNQTFAAIHHGTDDVERMGGAEHDQNRYVNIRCLDTGDYGFFCNGSMLDKWLMLHGEFRGQRKAGIAVKFNNVIKGAIIGCSFRDIDGPGIDLFGGNPVIAYRPGIVMVEQCEFIECGRPDAPAVDQGYGDLMSFTRCRIVTRTKTVKTGYIGSAQVYEDVEVDVRLREGDPAMMLRAVRNATMSRANGHTLRGVRANGPVRFVNDANSDNARFRKTLEHYGKPPGELDWDRNPTVHRSPPPGGWVHPFVLYDCDFGGERYAYSLLNVDTDGGRVAEQVDLGAIAGR